MATVSESLKNKSNYGGARPGAGRKPGGQNQSTKEKAAIKQAFLDRIYAKADELFEAQFRLAVGTETRPPDGKAIDSLLDRAFGKAEQNLDLTSKGESVALVRFIDASNQSSN